MTDVILKTVMHDIYTAGLAIRISVALAAVGEKEKMMSNQDDTKDKSPLSELVEKIKSRDSRVAIKATKELIKRSEEARKEREKVRLVK